MHAHTMFWLLDWMHSHVINFDCTTTHRVVHHSDMYVWCSAGELLVCCLGWRSNSTCCSTMLAAHYWRQRQ